MYSSNNNILQGGHPQQQQEQHRQGGIQQQQPPVVHRPQQFMHGTQHQQPHAPTQQQQQRQLPPQQQQIMNASNQIIGAQHQHNQQQQQLLLQQPRMQMRQDLLQLNVGLWSSQVGTQPQDVAYHQQQIDQKQDKSKILFTCLAARQWKKIKMQYGHFMFVRPGADPNSLDLIEGIDIVRSQFIYGDNRDTIPERYHELFESYVVNTDLGRHLINRNLNKLGTGDGDTSINAKRQRIEQEEEDFEQEIAWTQQKMEESQLELKLAEQQLKEDQRLHKQQLDVRSELEQQCSKEKDQCSKEKDLINQLMELSLQGGGTSQQQEQHDKMIAIQMYSSALKRQSDNTSEAIKEARRKELELLDTKVTAMEKRDKLAANVMITEERYRLAIEAKEQQLLIHQQQMALQQQQQMAIQQRQPRLQPLGPQGVQPPQMYMQQLEPYASSAVLLNNEVLSLEPTPERMVDILTTLQTESHKKKLSITVAILEYTHIGNHLMSTVQTCERCKSTASEDDKVQWDKAIGIAESLISSYKHAAEVELQLESDQPLPDYELAQQQQSLVHQQQIALVQQHQQRLQQWYGVQPPPSMKIVSADIADLDNYYAEVEPIALILKKLQQRRGDGVTLSLRFVQIDTERSPLPDTIRDELTKTLIRRLSSVVVDENNNVKGAFQLSYNQTTYW